ncbi:hypothetical protein [Methylobacter marinus]|uniref:hypothetical protein n=1 Tax=Methylobacter marinus TaxID=34058 RepID=UPI00036A4E1A|nr:hypothetical protein [Methylobacter marinus]
MAIVSTPLIEHLILKVVFKKVFNIDIPIDVPDVPAYIAGVILMALGGCHNLLFLSLENSKQKRLLALQREKQAKEEPHDQRIIEEIISFLPYDNTNYWIEQASYAGLRRDFSHNLDCCMRFSEPPYALYNEVVESKKQELVITIRHFNSKCAGYLGAQEDASGIMYLPPYHWKGRRDESEKRYYEMLHDVANAGQELLQAYDAFIKCVKSQGFIIGKI